MDDKGATKGVRPSAATRSAVWVAAGSGLVISTTAKAALLLEDSGSMMWRKVLRHRPLRLIKFTSATACLKHRP